MKFKNFCNRSFCKILKNFNFKKLLSKNTCEFCQNTTLHGMKYVADKDLNCCERCFFGISIISVLCIGIYLILRIYTKWKSSPIIVGINPQRSFTSEEPFPAVTICNLNQISKSKVSHFLKNSSEYNLLQFLCKREILNEEDIKNFNNWESFIINISQSCEDMLVKCRYASFYYDCGRLFYPLVTDGGLCCVFNILPPEFLYNSQGHLPVNVYTFKKETFYDYVNWSADHGYSYDQRNNFVYPRQVPGVGESIGLTITLNAEKDQMYCSSSTSVGFKFAVHPPNEWPSVQEMGIFVEPGKETKLHLKPEKTQTDMNLKSLPAQVRGCFFSSEMQLKYFAHYTQRNCEVEFMNHLLNVILECNYFYMPKMDHSVKFCDPLNDYVSSQNMQCLPNCNDLTYQIDAYSTKLSHEGLRAKHIISENYGNDSYLQDNIALVHMFFRETSFRSYKQMEFIGIPDFISSIGGLLGLFLGFSFLSIAELIYYAILRPFRYAINYFQSGSQNESGNIMSCSKNDTYPCVSASSLRNSKKMFKSFKKRHNRFLRSAKVYNQRLN